MENFVFYNDKNSGKISSCGYELNNLLLENKMSPMFSSMNNDIDISKRLAQSHGSFSNIFDDLAIPAGLLYIQETYKPNQYKKEPLEESITINDDLLNKLLNIKEFKKESRTRRRNRNSSKSKNNKTRKFKNN